MSWGTFKNNTTSSAVWGVSSCFRCLRLSGFYGSSTKANHPPKLTRANMKTRGRLQIRCDKWMLQALPSTKIGIYIGLEICRKIIMYKACQWEYLGTCDFYFIFLNITTGLAEKARVFLYFEINFQRVCEVTGIAIRVNRSFLYVFQVIQNIWAQQTLFTGMGVLWYICGYARKVASREQ